MTPPLVCVHLCAPNDRNGNPRRAFLFINEHNAAVFLWPESYAGPDCVLQSLRPLAHRATRINVSAGELRSWLKSAVPATYPTV